MIAEQGRSVTSIGRIRYASHTIIVLCLGLWQCKSSGSRGRDGWREEKTGLHESQFIETRRHWFQKRVHHHTNGTVQVLNLVEGDEVVVIAG